MHPGISRLRRRLAADSQLEQNCRVIRNTLAGAAVVSLLLSGCVSTVGGTAIRAQNAGPNARDVPVLKESDLDRVLLSIGELNGVVDVTGMRVSNSSQEMSDNSDAVSNLDCLGVLYGAEDMVYQGSDWTAVRDQVAQEPVDDNDHWVEQIAVLYPSAEKAKQFFDTSQKQWQKCAKSSIEITRSESDSTWDIEAATVNGMMLTQTANQQDAGGWGCQHALSVASNLTVETFACSDNVSDEAETMASDMIANAAKK
jgi:hypothetical protein